MSFRNLKTMSRFSRPILLSAFLAFCACGVEVVLLFIPAISATWCEEGNPCHKFQIWPDTTTNRFDHQGGISGQEFYLNPVDGLPYKDPYFEEQGQNTLIGTFEQLNVHLIIHKRSVPIEENELVGAMEINTSSGEPVIDRMELESLSNSSTVILTRQDGDCGCE